MLQREEILQREGCNGRICVLDVYGFGIQDRFIGPHERN
jgi:hypothetical protein